MNAEIEAVLFAINEEPSKFLHISKTAKISCGGKEYRIVKNNFKGGIEVYFEGVVIHLSWSKERYEFYPSL